MRDGVSPQAREACALHRAVEQALGAATVRRIYGAAEREALIVLWEASDRVCGKRLKAIIPTLIEAMERHGHPALAPEVRTGPVEDECSDESIVSCNRNEIGAAPGAAELVLCRRSADRFLFGRSRLGATRHPASSRRTSWRIPVR
jgi:hypothetical protein